jgi:NAD(P)-dependent dehydrogenase (short-subunit alcohol dehydrogenase family)
MKYQIRQMLTNGGGAIVNISSAAGLVAIPGIPIYTASKHGVVGLTKAVAVEYAKQGIRVNVVCPGSIQTDMYERFAKGNAQGIEQMKQMHPIGRVGKAEEIANAAIWLCCDGASFVTGQSLGVDGGYTAH